MRFPPTVVADIVNGTDAESFVIVRFFPLAVVAPTLPTLVNVIAKSPVVPVTLNESVETPLPLKATDWILPAVALLSVVWRVPFTNISVDEAPATTETASVLVVPVMASAPSLESKVTVTGVVPLNNCRRSSISINAGQPE